MPFDLLKPKPKPDVWGPPVSQEDYDQAVLQSQADEPTWKRLAGGALAGLGEVAKGFTMGDILAPAEDIAAMSPWEKGGAMLATAPFTPTSLKTGIKGLYSRAARAVEGFPAKINANRALNQVRQQASGEEIGWRKLDEFLKGKQGKAVERDEILGHLEENPLQVKVTERSGSSDNYLRHSVSDFVNDTVPVPTNYDQYQMPGAQNYRETLLQLDRPTGNELDLDQWYETIKRPQLPDTAPAHFDELDLISKDYLQKQYQHYLTEARQGFSSHHWDEPNVLVHVRHNERALGNRPIQPDDLGQGELRFDGGSPERYEWAFQTPRAELGRKDLMTGFGETEDTARQNLMEYLNNQERTVPTNVGRMIENIQSDWHQRGAHHGYANDPNAGQTIQNEQILVAESAARQTYQQRLQEAAKAIEEWHPDYEDVPEDILRSEDASFIWNRLAHEVDKAEEAANLGGDPAITAHAAVLRGIQADVRNAQTEYLNAVDAARRVANDVVPDAPFKDSWPELALKQQLTDIAHNRPDLEWLGIAPSSELRARGEVISPEFQDKQLPNSLAKLLKPFGGSVEQAPVISKETHLNPVVRSLEFGSREFDAPRDLSWTEVQRALNDQTDVTEPIASVWPAKTEHGAWQTMNPDLEAKELLNSIKQTNPYALRPDHVEAIIARLTPEILASIREKGFPLLLALLGLQASVPQSNGNLSQLPQQ